MPGHVLGTSNEREKAGLQEKREGMFFPKKRREGGIEPLGRQPPQDLKSCPSASQDHHGTIRTYGCRIR